MIEKDYVNTQWRSIHEEIDNIFIVIADYFTNEFLQQRKQNTNILQFQLRDTKNTRKKITLGDVLYSQIVMIRRSILKNKVTNEAQVREK